MTDSGRMRGPGQVCDRTVLVVGARRLAYPNYPWSRRIRLVRAEGWHMEGLRAEHAAAGRRLPCVRGEECRLDAC